MRDRAIDLCGAEGGRPRTGYALAGGGGTALRSDAPAAAGAAGAGRTWSSRGTTCTA